MKVAIYARYSSDKLTVFQEFTDGAISPYVAFSIVTPGANAPVEMASTRKLSSRSISK